MVSKTKMLLKSFKYNLQRGVCVDMVIQTTYLYPLFPGENLSY